MPSYTKCSSCRKRILKGTKCECRKDAYKRYDKEVRRNEDNLRYTNFYNSIAWIRLSKQIKNKYNGMCISCLLDYLIIKPCDVVHHIETIRDDWDKRLDEKNLIPLCHGCHNNIDHVNYTEDIKEKLRNLLKEYEEKYI